MKTNDGQLTLNIGPDSATFVQSEKNPHRTAWQELQRKKKETVKTDYVIGLSDATRLQGNSESSFRWSPYVQASIFRNSIKIFKACDGTISGKEYSEQTQAAREAVKFQGIMSERTKKTIENIIVNWEGAIKHFNNSKLQNPTNRRKQLVFFTLTLSQQQRHDDRFIKRYMLNAFLSAMRTLYGQFNYLWVAEKQTKNTNNIHFHVITDIYIHYKVLAEIWDDVQQRVGYLSNAQRLKHKSASTEIHAIDDVNNVSRYVSKYIQKDDSKSEVLGRLWSCSRELKLCKSPRVSLTASQFNELIDNHSEHLKPVHVDENCMVICVDSTLKASSILPYYEVERAYCNDLNSNLLFVGDFADIPRWERKRLDDYFYMNYVVPF
jgi:hypothetical protein